jgi:hypothetical protein
MNVMEEAPSQETTEFAKLSQLQKLAGFLLMLEPDNAARIMEQLEPSELEAVSAEMAKFSSISHPLQNEILEEFLPVALQATTAIPGGVARAKVILEKAVGLFRASDIIGRVSVRRPTVAAPGQTQLRPANRPKTIRPANRPGSPLEPGAQQCPRPGQRLLARVDHQRPPTRHVESRGPAAVAPGHNEASGNIRRFHAQVHRAAWRRRQPIGRENRGEAEGLTKSSCPRVLLTYNLTCKIAGLKFN